jgi:hypothetical protein
VRDLWTCPDCGRGVAKRNHSHACAPLRSVDELFAGTDAPVRAAFDQVLAAASALGPVRVLPERTRIALQVRMSFAAFMPRRHWLNGHLVLAERVDSPRFTRIDVISARNIVHAFRLTSAAEVDAEFRGWLAAAYQVGAQQHLRR